MKIIATIFLFVFVLLQAGPVLSTMFSGDDYALVVEDEKAEDKTEKDNKHNKDLTSIYQTTDTFSHVLIYKAIIPFSEMIGASPLLEEPMLPPNFS